MIRKETKNKKSLDDVMRTLWQTYGKPEEGVPEGAIDQVLIDFGGEAIRPLVSLCLDTTKELPLADILAEFGVTLNWEYPDELKPVGDAVPLSLGIKMSGSQMPKITQVAQDSPAQKAGLSAFDKLVAVDNCQVSSKNLSTLLQSKLPGEKVCVHVFREERLLGFEVVLEPAKKSEAKLSLMTELNDTQKMLREGWLGL